MPGGDLCGIAPGNDGVRQDPDREKRPRRMAGAAGDLSEVPSGGADRSSQAPEGILQGNAHREAFSTVSGPWPVVYNGDIWTAEDAAALSRDFPGTDAVMLGRGLMRDPSLLRRLRGGPAASVREVRTYHDRLLDAYRQRLSGDLPVMHRMWELWTYLAAGFDGAEPYLKRMRKAKNLSEYQAAVDALLREQPLVYSKEG